MTEKNAIESLVDRLIQASIGGCSCGTITPLYTWHDPLCHFRLFSECIEALARTETPEERAKLRPADFMLLSPREQWEIDKQLGILDWEGASPRPPITREQFLAATGREPINDDLDRCNCAKVGEVGHFNCGWDDAQNLPVFLTSHSHSRSTR